MFLSSLVKLLEAFIFLLTLLLILQDLLLVCRNAGKDLSLALKELFLFLI